MLPCGKTDQTSLAVYRTAGAYLTSIAVLTPPYVISGAVTDMEVVARFAAPVQNATTGKRRLFRILKLGRSYTRMLEFE